MQGEAEGCAVVAAAWAGGEGEIGRAAASLNRLSLNSGPLNESGLSYLELLFARLLTDESKRREREAARRSA